MSSPADRNLTNDEALVAFLDDELPAEERGRLEAMLADDANLQARFDGLARSRRAIAEAFEGLLDEAPAARLSSMLQAAEAARRAPPAVPRERGGWRPALIAAAAALLIVGGIAGYLSAPLFGRDEASRPDYWREIVAKYVMLYTPETFAGIPDDTAIHAVALSAVGKKVGLDLTPEKVALPGLVLKGGIIFTLDDKPLAQVAYLSPTIGPVAFCIIADGQPDRSRTFETREGLNMVYWAKGGRGFLVVGTAPRAEIEAYAASLDGRVS